MPTEAATVRQRIRGMKNEITVNPPLLVQYSDAASPAFVYAASSIYLP
jgi:hypothetical protein